MERIAGGKPRRLKAAFNPGISAFARFRGYGLILTLFPEGNTLTGVPVYSLQDISCSLAAWAYLTACLTSSRAFYALVQANPYSGLPGASRSSWHFLVDSIEGGKWRVEGGEACRREAEAAESRFQPRNKRFCAFPGIWSNPISFPGGNTLTVVPVYSLREISCSLALTPETLRLFRGSERPMAALAYLTACPTSSRAFSALVQANPYRGMPEASRGG